MPKGSTSTRQRRCSVFLEGRILKNSNGLRILLTGYDLGSAEVSRARTFSVGLGDITRHTSSMELARWSRAICRTSWDGSKPPELEAIPLDPYHGRNVNAVKQSFDEECQSRAVDREQARSLGVGQTYVLHELRKTMASGPDEETRARLLLFDEVFRER